MFEYIFVPFDDIPLPDHFPHHQGFSNSRLCRLAFDFGSWLDGEGSIIYGSSIFPNLEKVILIDDTARYSSQIGSYTIIPHDEDGYTVPLIIGGCWTNFEMIEISEFKERATKAFGSEIDPDPYDEDEDWNRTNLWLEEGKTPPSISIMRMLPSGTVNSQLNFCR